MADDGTLHRDFFISRAGKDAEFAIWLGKLIAALGKTYVLQDEHFQHQNFMGAMDAALTSGAKVVGLLSQAYLESDYCIAEAAAALKGDPLNRQKRLILLRLEPCAPGGVLVNIAYTDLLAERRQADAGPLVLKILRALGLDAGLAGGLPPEPGKVPRPPEGTLTATIQQLHPEVREVPGFAGREAELAALEEALWRKGGTAALTNAPATAAVKGLGGVGKSVLAREYAWRNRARYQGVWWIRAERRETLAEDLIELGARLEPDLREVNERDKAVRRTLDWIEQAGFEKPWLLVYDNVEEPGDIEGLTPRVGAQVLITTQWSDWGRLAAPVAVGVFPPDLAAKFLLEGTGRSDRAGAEKLAAALGHLPLALDHAAAYVRRTGIDFAAYQALAVDLLQKAPRGVEYDKPVFATFWLAIDKASEACPEAQKLMGLCAFLAPDRIPLSLFTDDVLSEITRTEAVAALQEVSLATPEPLDDGSPGLSMHRLVQATMRARLKNVGEHDNAVALATELVADAFPFDSDDVREWPVCARLMPHALAVSERAPEIGQAAVKTTRLLTSAGLNYYARAAWRDAERLYVRALDIDEKNQGADHSDVARDLNNLALLFHDTNRLAEAEPLYRRSLAIDEKYLGAGHPKVATSLNNLALLLQATNRLDEAEQHFRRALAIDEKSLGPDDPEVATDLNNLAELLRITNRLDEAAPLVHRALAIDTSRFGADHPYVARELANLAQLLRARGSLAEAESVMRRALAITETGLGRNHPDVALRLYDLAHLLQPTNRLAEAEPLMLRVVEILERSEQNTGHRHPRYEDAIRNLAALEAELRAGGAAPEGSAMGSDPQGLTPTPAAPQPPARKRGFMGGLFPRRA